MATDMRDMSRIRREMRTRVERLSALVEVLCGRSPLLAGTLYEHRTRCGKPSCRCAKEDYRHRSWCVSFRDESGAHTHVVAPERQEAIGLLTDEYHRVRRARRALRALTEELDALAQKAQRLRGRAGRKRYHRLSAGRSGGRGEALPSVSRRSGRARRGRRAPYDEARAGRDRLGKGNAP